MYWLLFLALIPAFSETRVGAASVPITPPPGAPMAGYYYNRAAEGVHDPLLAKALVFDIDGQRAALVACDLANMPEMFAVEARRIAVGKTGIPVDRIMISGTHTHTGPVLLTPDSRYRLEGSMLRIAQEYARDLPGKIAEAIEAANRNLKPARISAVTGREDSVAFNRRFLMKDGTIKWNPAKQDPNIVRPAGPIDPDVHVVAIDGADGKPVAVYVNHALHLDTVGGMQFSADFPYTIGRALSQVKGDALLTLFSMGCAGNVNHRDISSRDPQKGHGEAARIGTVLAAEVLKASRYLLPVPGSLRASTETIGLPLPAITAADVEKAGPVAATFGAKDAAPFADLVWAAKVLDVDRRKGRPLDAEVQVIAFGSELAFVGLPGEIFTELGMEIKRRSPFRQTIVVTQANGTIGYVPNRKAYPEGAYEVVSARVGPGAGEMLVDSAVKQLTVLFNNR